MSFLAIEQLENDTPIYQKIRLLRSTNLEAIRLNICKSGNLTDGIVSIEVLNAAHSLGTLNLSYEDINTVGTNFHGYIRFLPDTAISIRKLSSEPHIELTLKVTIVAHTNSDNAFISLVKEPYPFVDQYNISNNPNSPANLEIDVWYRPFGIELYTN